jgi:hypothetical protein
LLNIAPSNGVTPRKPYGYAGPLLDITTTVDQVGSFNNAYAWDAYTARCLKAGTIPFWDPYQGLGQPFLPVGSSAVFYPVNWLHLILPPAWWDLVFLLNWLLASLFLYYYLRIIDIEPPPALIGALAIFACGSIAIYLHCREVPGVAAWWPLLLYAIERAYRQPAWRGRHITLAVAVFCSVAGGQPEVTAASLLAAGVYAVFRILASGKKGLSLLLRLGPGTIAGLLLSAPHWLNFADYAFSSHSEHVSGGGKGLIHLSLQTVGSYVFPYFYGRVWHHPFGQATFDWTYSPGWVTPLCLFLALASLVSLRVTRRLEVSFMWLVALLVLAKIFNAPGIKWLGRLPILDLIIFPRYAAFLTSFALAILAAFGVSFLARANNRTWLFWILAWTAAVFGVFAVGLRSIWATLSQAGGGAESRDTFIVFGLGGLAWALIQPLVLWWVRYRKPNDGISLYTFAALGILLHAVAFAPNGYSLKTYAALSAAGLSTYVLLGSAIAFINDHRTAMRLNLAGFCVVALAPILASAFSASGLNYRYNPLTPPPFMASLVCLQEGGVQRSYSLGPVPAPDFAAPFGLSSLDTINAISPDGTARFLADYLDPSLSGLYFVGHRSTLGPPYMSALDQIKWNKRYYNLAAVKYLVTTDLISGGVDPNLYDSVAVFLSTARPVPIERPLRSTFVPTTDVVSTIEVPIGTYERKNAGFLRLRVLDEDGNLLESREVPTLDLINNALCPFQLSETRGVKSKRLQLVLDFRTDSKDSMIAAYVPPDPSYIGFAFRASSPERAFRLVYRDDDTRTDVWENNQANARVFLAPEVKVAPSAAEALSALKDIPDLTRSVWVDHGEPESDTDPQLPAGCLREFRLSPNEVWIKYSAQMPGVLTVVDSFGSGWRADVNGKEVPVLRVDGVFRGVRIEHPGDVAVHFWYRPPRWNLSLGLCGLGLIILSFASLNKLRWPVRGKISAFCAMF